jgi:antitoxin MazE
MKTLKITKLTDIGNSKGIILPKQLIQKYELSDKIEISESEKGILISKAKNPREGWGEAFRKAVHEQDYEQLIPDVLDDDPLDEY